MLHRVRPHPEAPFQPNRSLEVTPEFLDETIRWLRGHGYQFVSLDEARSRLVSRRTCARFVSVTLDDGYRDNMIWAKPIFERYGVPYTIYVPTSFAAGEGSLWWLTIETVIGKHNEIEVDGETISCRTLKDKTDAYARLLKFVSDLPSRAAEIAFVRAFAERHGVDDAALARSVCMDWGEIRTIAREQLATIGAHTKTHLMLAKATDREVWDELAGSRQILERELGQEVRHLAYPYGSEDVVGEREFRIAAEVGYATAVTTRLGVLTSEDADRLAALPRINVDGRYQRKRYLDVLLSGVAPALWSAAKALTRSTRVSTPSLAWLPLLTLPL
jgi:peptidoglycan/xylan/chitin deacetylase (PgdA/CDA1 family)